MAYLPEATEILKQCQDIVEALRMNDQGLKETEGKGFKEKKKNENMGHPSRQIVP
jgi:hypothetical protein